MASQSPTFLGSESSHGLLNEYVVARHLLRLDDGDLAQLARNSITHSCAPGDVKAELLAEVDQWLLR